MAASKVFIVTGASKGVGAAVTQHLLDLSHKVVITARSAEPLEAFKKANPGRVEVIAGDITSPEVAQNLTKTAISSFGRLDGMVINHSVLEPVRMSDETAESLKKIYDVNVFSCFAVAQAGLSELRKTNGAIAWVSSGAATKAYVAWGAYGSSKAAVNSISAHFASENPEITSVAIQPGRVDTDMQAQIRAKGGASMDKDQYQNFKDVHEEGGLLKPSQPGNVLAKFVADPLHELSGEFLAWNAESLAKYQS
ncbi:NAD(P)-binding protein [Sarocladium strictum]